MTTRPALKLGALILGDLNLNRRRDRHTFCLPH
jgi:hypothetical protein